MRRFEKLFSKLDETINEERKVEAFITYFTQVNDKDIMWALALFSGKRPKRIVSISNLQTWTSTVTGYPEWLMNESFGIVGDATEFCALLMNNPPKQEDTSLFNWIVKINRLQKENILEKEIAIKQAWEELSYKGRLIFNKLITGSFRIDVPTRVLIRALSAFLNKKENHIAQRIQSSWHPDKTTFEELFLIDNILDGKSEYFHFMPINQITSYHELPRVEDISEWQIEKIWPGKRCQLVVRQGHAFLWTEEGLLITNLFPELNNTELMQKGNWVLEGMIVVLDEEEKPSFPLLQKRLNRKTASKKIVVEMPAGFLAMDVLESEGEVILERTTAERREILETIVLNQKSKEIFLSGILFPSGWDELKKEVKNLNQQKLEGISLKKRDDTYGINSKSWLWKSELYSAKAVLLYATKGDSRRGDYIDFTLGVWDKGDLVSLTKVAINNSFEISNEIITYINKNAIERFGPVRVVKPKLVFELTYEAVYLSARHKSGVKLRKPKLQYWLQDLTIDEVSSLASIKQNI